MSSQDVNEPVESSEFPPLQRKSIATLLADKESHSPTGNSFMDDIMIFGNFYQQRMLEYGDRKEIMGIGRRAVKLGVLSLFITGLSNRLLTRLKFKKFDFLNLRFFIRFPIRIGVTVSVFYFCLLVPIFGHLMVVLDKMNDKYYDRMEQFQLTRDPLTLNPGLLDEPDFSEEERANTMQFVENIRMQQKQAQMGGKMM